MSVAMAYKCSFVSLFGLFLSVRISSAANDTSSAPKYPLGDPRNCPLSQGMNRFEVLPGGGWDNLRNVHMGEVAKMNYSLCKSTDDGKYLIPDDVFIYPMKRSKVEVFADFYDHWTNYSSTTTKSINAEVSGSFHFGSVSGSFSSEYESVKKHQVEDKSVTTRVQMRHFLYTIRLQPDCPLQPVFKSRLLDIAAHLQYNNTAYANFLAQLLVRDYGTHVITSVDAGAVVAKVDHLTKKFVADFNEDKSKITAAASASFFGVFGAKASFSQTTDKKTLDEYTKNTVYSTVLTFGGPSFRINYTINQWEDGLQDNLVPVDRSGDPLHYAITPGILPEIPEEMTFKLANVVEWAIVQYYKHNTIKGCTKLDSPNFSFQANLDDGSCQSPTNNYTFGGVFQTCQFEGSPAGDPCAPLLQKNPITSDYSCSSEYEPILVHEGSTPHSCHRDCRSCWWFFRCCHDSCGFAKYSTYWCVAKGQVPVNTGYLFGGLYSTKFKNPITQGASCPFKFYPLRFGATVHVCVSDDYELGFQGSVPFAGFFSCNAGNPLAVKETSGGGNQGLRGLSLFVSQSGPAGWPKTCPTGYSQHLASIEQDCEISYCVKSNAFNIHGLPVVKRPPYTDAPKIFNFSVPLLLVNRDTGQIWFKRQKGNDWILATNSSVTEFIAQTNLQEPGIVNLDPVTGNLVPARHEDGSANNEQQSEHSMRPGTAAGITFGVTALAGLMIAFTVIGWRRHKNIQRRSTDFTLTVPLNSQPEYGAVSK